ncbi:hypothetical protein ISS39_09505 [Candidatus Bathyarchaeota archaeon]|nr:hypothetical protein [Candidatus Bathyarchaeota archaeon]
MDVDGLHICLVGGGHVPDGFHEAGVRGALGGVEEGGASCWADVSMGPEKFFAR